MDDSSTQMKKGEDPKVQAKIQGLATEISRRISWIPTTAIMDQIGNIHAQHRSLITEEARIDRPGDLQGRLDRISGAAQALVGELNTLSPDACGVLQSPIEPFITRWTAGVYELAPRIGEAGALVEVPDQGILHPPLISRLQALAKVSQTAGAWVSANCKDGGYRRRLPTTSQQSQQVLFRRCAEMLGHWLSAPSASRPGGILALEVKLFEQLLLFIGQRIHEIATDAPLAVTPRLKPAVKPQGSQWGRAAAREAKAWLFGTPPNTGDLQNKPPV